MNTSTAAEARESFEAYWLSSRKGHGAGKAERMLVRDPDGDYADQSTQRHWWTWQNAQAMRSVAQPRPDGYWETPEGRAAQLAARAYRFVQLMQTGAPATLLESARAILQESVARLPCAAAARGLDDTPLETGEGDAR